MPLTIKICGITRVEDALVAVEEGASMLGLVFAAESPRYVDPARAREIAVAARSGESAGDAGLEIVGVFRNQSPEIIRAIAETVGLDLVQLHGEEDDAAIAAIGRPVIKAISVGDAVPSTGSYPSASWFLFDRLDREKGGGSGRSFDWSLLTSFDRRKKFFLAGGIGPENVALAISQVRPDGLDVSSGVEVSPGIKSREKIRALFDRVRRSR